MRFRKHREGCYRGDLGDGRFVQIRRYRATYLCPPCEKFLPDGTGRLWGIEVRHTESGDIIRFAGVWDSLRSAKEEAATL